MSAELQAVQGDGLAFNEELRRAYANLHGTKEPRKEKRGKNIAENWFANWFLRGGRRGQGWRVTKRGWPDFMCYNEATGKVLLVEVKPDEHTQLEPEQFRVARLLKLAGVDVVRWSPDVGFQEIPMRDDITGLRGPERKRIFT